MRYAHLADLHLGAFRDEKMRSLSTKAFLRAMDLCVEKRVDFILFAGDMFNTSIPSLDILKIVTKKLKEVHDLKIPIYVIAGSHDFSASGKTMIDVLENAGLLVNVCKGSVNSETKELELRFTVDEKTGAKIVGVVGRKGQLDSKYYQSLNRSILQEEKGYKIFLFHTTISELLNNEFKMIDSSPISFLPIGFDYYAGGHIHIRKNYSDENYKFACYPGPLFPVSFSEIEKLEYGSFNIVEVDENSQGEFEQKVESVDLKVIDYLKIVLKCENKDPEQITNELIERVENLDVENKLVTIRLFGRLNSGMVSDVDFKKINKLFDEKGAFVVLRNTNKLVSKEFEQISKSTNDPKVIEDEIIKEHLGQSKIFKKEIEFGIIKSLIHTLNTSKMEGENIATFESRVEEEIESVFNLHKNELNDREKIDDLNDN
jgi:DNA repair protein SbcD/Mre11